MAYATLSDPQKRTIYDRYGDEDPDNHGAGGMGAHFRRRGGGGGGPEMTPEEIFNAFFGGGMAGGMGPGMHFYSSGFGPGMQFRTAGGMPPRGRGQQQQQQQQNQQQQPQSGLGMLLQLLPVVVILLASFFSTDTASYAGMARTMPGENQYFSLLVSYAVRLLSMLALQQGLLLIVSLPVAILFGWNRTSHLSRILYKLNSAK